MERVLNFGVNKSDDEIIYGPIGRNYPFNYEINVLITNSKDNRRGRRYRREGGNPPRPLNSFFTYRKNKSADPEFKGKEPEFISGEISKRWKEEPDEIKELFRALARKAKEEHRKRYANYKYQPRKPRNKQEKKARKKAKQNEPTSLESFTDQPIPSNFSTPLLSTDDDSQYMGDESSSSPSLSNSPEYDNDEHMMDATTGLDIYPNNFSTDFTLFEDHNDHDGLNNALLQSDISSQEFGYVPEDNATSPPPITQFDFFALVNLVDNLSYPECILLISFLSKNTDPLPFDFTESQQSDIFVLADLIDHLPGSEYELLMNSLSKKVISTDPPPFDLTHMLTIIMHNLPDHEYYSLLSDLLSDNSENTQSPDNTLLSETDLSLHTPYIPSHNLNLIDSFQGSRSLQ